MEQPHASEARLDDLFRAYAAACTEPAVSANFMPDLWEKIQAREVSTNLFRRVAKALVAAAIAASVILGIMSTSTNPPSAFFDATFVEALRADHVSKLEPLH